MKFILPIILSFPLFVNAQDCTIKKETDPYTKEIKLSTGFIFFSGASVTVDADKTEIIFLFSTEGTEKCFDNNSSATLFFENSKVKTNIRNGGTMNCEGLFQFVFKNSRSNPSALQKILNQKINHIVFVGNSKKEITVNIDPPEQETFRKLATCLVNEAKTLVK